MEVQRWWVMWSPEKGGDEGTKMGGDRGVSEMVGNSRFEMECEGD